MSIEMLSPDRTGDVFDLDVREIGEVAAPECAYVTEGCTQTCTCNCASNQGTCTGPTWPCCC